MFQHADLPPSSSQTVLVAVKLDEAGIAAATTTAVELSGPVLRSCVDKWTNIELYI